MDNREKRQAIYMILTAVEQYNHDPKGVGALLESLGEPTRTIMLTGDDMKKIQAVSQVLDSERCHAILLSVNALELEIEPLDIPEEGESVDPRDRRIAKLERELVDASEAIKSARKTKQELDTTIKALDDARADVSKLREQNRSFESALGEAQKKITALEKKLEKEK